MSGNQKSTGWHD